MSKQNLNFREHLLVALAPHFVGKKDWYRELNEYVDAAMVTAQEIDREKIAAEERDDRRECERLKALREGAGYSLEQAAAHAARAEVAERTVENMISLRSSEEGGDVPRRRVYAAALELESSVLEDYCAGKITLEETLAQSAARRR